MIVSLKSHVAQTMVQRKTKAKEIIGHCMKVQKICSEMEAVSYDDQLALKPEPNNLHLHLMALLRQVPQIVVPVGKEKTHLLSTTIRCQQRSFRLRQQQQQTRTHIHINNKTIRLLRILLGFHRRR